MSADILLNLAAQVPMVAAFIVFTLRIIDIFIKQQERQEISFLETLKQRDLLHQTNLESIQKNYTTAIELVAQEIRDSTKILQLNTKKLDRIDESIMVTSKRSRK